MAHFSAPASRLTVGISPDVLTPPARATGTLNLARDGAVAPMLTDAMQAQDAPGVPVWAWAVGGVSVAGALGLVAWKVLGKKGRR